MEKNILVEQTITAVSESNQQNCSTSKDQQLHSHNTNSSNYVPNQHLLNKQFSEKWTEFSNSIKNLGLVLQENVSEISIKYLTILTKNIQSKVTPTQAVEFVINSASR